ncbi:MAG: serine/threonine protein kinase, partial [Myxococcales bacterium]|nr:serine/threonine protein kinase [Myxococcales bacterium]
AMARLSHPNVVQVYEIHEGGDASEDDDAQAGPTFVVMEYVDGLTLRAWLGETSRTRDEILTVFTAAGRGLAAAHDKGLVHRDFKPDNVMIDGQGRVLVMDFGLARGEEGEGSGEGASTRDQEALLVSTGNALSVDLTRTGALMGTPAYMAPEQFAGQRGDARSDQFSFCVALWEALLGRRPFIGDSLLALSQAVMEGRPQAPGTGDLPIWLRAVLERGLAREPGQRWPTMAELLEALAGVPARRRRRRALTLVGVLATVSVAAGFTVARAREQAAIEDSCSADARAITADWNPTVEAELERAFTAGGLGFAATSWAHARPSITAFAERWTVIREQACRETKLEGRRSEAALARIESCLDEQRATVAGLLETWRGANQAVVTRAPLAAAGLEDPGLCLDELALARRPLPDEAQARAQVQVLRTRIERAQLKERAGEVGGAQQEIDTILAEAEALGWVPLQAEADLAHGRILSAQNGFAAARAEEERAFERAMATGHDLIALRASIGLISLIGYHGADAKVGLGWARLAAALLERLGLTDSVDAGDYQRA